VGLGAGRLHAFLRGGAVAVHGGRGLGQFQRLVVLGVFTGDNVRDGSFTVLINSDGVAVGLDDAPVAGFADAAERSVGANADPAAVILDQDVVTVLSFDDGGAFLRVGVHGAVSVGALLSVGVLLGLFSALLEDVVSLLTDSDCGVVAGAAIGALGI